MLLALVKEVGTWGQVKISSFFQGNEFKIPLAKLKVRKILLNSSESARESMDVERRGERVAVNVGEECGTHCMEFVTLVIPSKSEAYLDPSRTSALELFYENT